MVGTAASRRAVDLQIKKSKESENASVRQRHVWINVGTFFEENGFPGLNANLAQNPKWELFKVQD